MNVSLTPEMESWIQQKVQSGYYQSASEVVRDAIRLLHDYDGQRATKLLELRAELLKGMDDIEMGRVKRVDEHFLDDIEARGRKRLEAEQNAAVNSKNLD